MKKTRSVSSDFPAVEDQALPRPAKAEAPTDDERRAFTACRLELASLIQKDFDARMTPTVKLVALYLLECVNSETLLCFPSYRTILETLSLGKSEKTVQRAIAVLRKRGWLYVWRPNPTKSNRFVFLRNDAVVTQILDYQDYMKARREEDRLEREERERTQMSGQELDVGTQMSDGERTPVSGKSFNVIHEPVLGIEYRDTTLDANSFTRVNVLETEIAYPKPENEAAGQKFLAEICEGREPLEIVREVLMGFLMAGSLTPAKAEAMLRPAARKMEAA
jgi:hypothetical protein